MKQLKHIWPHALLVVVSALLIYGMIDIGQDWGGDFASYIMQAKALTEGDPGGFIEAHSFIIERTTHSFAPVAYPWGYPAMLAPVYAVFGHDVVALKVIGVVCYLSLLITIAVGFRKTHPGVWLVGFVGLFAVNPMLLSFLNKLNSDIPFLLISTACVLLIGRYAVERKRIFGPLADGLALGVLIAAACTIRTNGVLLLFTLLITQVMPRVVPALRPASHGSEKSGPWVKAAPYLSFIAVILVWRSLLPSGGSTHLDFIRTISPGTVKSHLMYYGLLPQEFYTGAPYPLAVYLISLMLAALGVVRRFKSDQHVAIYLLITYILYVVWPSLQGIRFFFPVLPFYISFVFTGMEVVQEKAAGQKGLLARVAFLVPVLVVTICFFAQSYSQVRDNLARDRVAPLGPYNADAADMFAFISSTTQDDSTFVFHKPRVLMLMTGRKAYSAYDTDEVADADYLVLVSEYEPHQVRPDLAEQLVAEGSMEPVFQNDGFLVYRVLKERP